MLFRSLVYKWGYLQLFKNLGNLHFKDVTAAAGLRQWMNSNGAVWLDYDRDGLLDLYVTGYFRSDIDFWNLRTTRIMHNSFEFATNGGEKHPVPKPPDGPVQKSTHTHRT